MDAMHEMQPIVADVHGVCPSVCPFVRQSVCLSRGSTRLRCAKTAERIKMLFGVNILGAHDTLCYTGVLIPQTGGGAYF